MDPTKNSTNGSSFLRLMPHFDRQFYSLRPPLGRESPSKLHVKDRHGEDSIASTKIISTASSAEQNEQRMGNRIAKPKVKTNKLTELTDQQIELLMQTTKLSAYQICQWHASFIHECPSGKLDRKRFIEIYQQFYPQGKAGKFCSLAFKAFDRDHNGYIDFHEFLTAIALTISVEPTDRLTLAFTMYDINGDGCLDKKEISHILKLIYELNRCGTSKEEITPEIRARQIIDQFDLDGDRKLSRDEFVNGCLNDPELRKLLTP